MANQPNTPRDSKPPTDKKTGITGASEHAVQYNGVSNSFWALLHWVISIWRFGFGRQKPQDDQRSITDVSGNVVGGNIGVYNGSFSVGNSMSSPPQTQISEDDKPEDDRERRNVVVSGNVIENNRGSCNGIFSVGNNRLL